MENKQLWYTIQSIYNSVDFINVFYPENMSIHTSDNWYRVDIIDGSNSISLTVDREYSIIRGEDTYSTKVLYNGWMVGRDTNKVINNEFIPRLRDLKLDLII